MYLRLFLSPLTNLRYSLPPLSYSQHRQVIRQTSTVLHQFRSSNQSDLTTDISSDLSEIRSFLSIFPTSNSFFPQTLILLTHVLTFTMISPHVLFPLISFRFHHSHQARTVANAAKSIRRSIEEQELSTCEVLRPAPSPIRSHIARLRQWSASTPTPPRTHDATLYHEESSLRGLPTSTIPHNGMKRRQVAESESVPCSPTLGRHLEAQTTAPHRGSQWLSLCTSSQPYSR